MTRVVWLCVFLAIAGSALAADPRGGKLGKSSIAEKKFCENSTPEEMIGSYGRVWGPLGKEGGISGKESQAIEDKLVDFYLCRAISDKNLASCSSLAKLPYRGAEEETLAGRCKSEFYRLGFDEFLAGRSAAVGGCQTFIHDWGVGQRVGAPAAAICDVLQSRRNEPVCSALAVRGWSDANCQEDVPSSAKDCRGKSNCLGRWELHQAVTKRNAARCPGYLRSACRNWIAESPAECAEAEALLRKTYCKLHAQAYERTKGSTARHGGAGIEWVTIPGGSFMMGSEEGSDEKPRHRVTVRTFQLAKTLVTKAQYKACVDAGNCVVPSCNWPAATGEENLPVVCVSWPEAKKFSEWLGGRLPSESEWEYAARSSGKDWKYPWGNEAMTCERVVTGGCNSSAEPVCSKPEGNTQQGLCDMTGNVWGWTQDWYHSLYNGAPTDGSAWETPTGSERVFRGGSWYDDEGDACAAGRGAGDPNGRLPYLGLRPARSQ